jgi:Transcriptional regulator PadR-like family.
MACKQMHMSKDFKHIIMKLIILKKLAKGKEYSYKIIKDMQDIAMSRFVTKGEGEIKNDVYNTISSLEKDGLIKAAGHGGRRRYYSLTRNGRGALQEADRLMVPIFKELKGILER